MGFRFRRSVGLGKGIRVNLSKGGIGVSAGVKGARVGFGPRGAYVSGGIQGTGLCGTSYARAKARTSRKAVIASPAIGTPVLAEFPSQGLMGLSPPLTGVFWIGATISAVVIRFPMGVVVAAALLIIWYVRKKSKSVELGERYQAARAHIVAGRYKDAAELIAQVARERPSACALLALGHARCLAQELIPAAAAYKEYLVANPTDMEVSIRYASLAMSQEEFKEALAMLEKLPAAARDTVPVLSMIGDCLVKTGQAHLAVEVLRNAPLRTRRPDPALTSIRYTLGLAYHQTGDKRRALAMFNRVYADDPKFSDVKQRVEELQKK